MKKKLQTLFLAGALSLMGIFSACVEIDPQGRGYSVAVPLSIVNATLARQFPAKVQRSFGTVEIRDPNILGQQDGNRLNLGTAFNFTNMLIPNGIGGAAKFASGVRFDPATKNLYLSNLMVEELKFNNFSLSHYLTPDMRQSLAMVIAQTIEKKPIYNIQKAGMIGSSFVRGIDIRNGQLYITFGL